MAPGGFFGPTDPRRVLAPGALRSLGERQCLRADHKPRLRQRGVPALPRTRRSRRNGGRGVRVVFLKDGTTNKKVIVVVCWLLFLFGGVRSNRGCQFLLGLEPKRMVGGLLASL